MTRNEKYWRNRKAQRMFEYMQSAEETADQIAALYRKASRYLTSEMENIFEKYMTENKLSEDEARKLIGRLHDRTSIEELVQQLKNGSKEKGKLEFIKEIEAPAYQARIERLQQLQNQLDLVMKHVYQQEKDFSTAHYVDLANETYYKSIFDIQQRAGVGFSFSHIDQKQIDTVMNSKWSGKNYSKRIWDNTKSLAQNLKEELLINLVTGRTEREVAKILENKFAQGASIARRLVRTESCYLSNQMEMKSYEELEIEEYLYLATLDLRTSKICASLDGRRFLVSEQQPGVNCPPMHPWCRSTTIAYISEKAMANMKRRAFNPKKGTWDIVPASMNYSEWYEKYVKNNPEALAEQKKIQNYSADKKQHQHYREVLGNRVPESFAKFQDMKYNEPKKWEFVKMDYKRQNELLKNPEQKLPDAEKVNIPEEKFTKYLLGGENEKGLAKGKAFTSRLGYDIDNWKGLRNEIKRGAIKYTAVKKGENEFGTRYEQQMILYGKKGTPANVVVGWINRTDGSTNMTSAYIKEVK